MGEKGNLSQDDFLQDSNDLQNIPLLGNGLI